MKWGSMENGAVDMGMKLDPRTKLLLMMVINVTIFGAEKMYILLMMGAIPLVLLFISKKGKPAFYCTLLYIAAVLVNECLIPSTQGAVNILLVMISGVIYRVMPGFIMGYYLVTTTTVSEFIASMERMHISPKIIIPMSVMFRFFPTIGEEGSAIGDAMRMRGISFGSEKFFQNPMAMLEYRLVPLLMSTVRIGEELSAASLTRGLGNPVRRTNICKIGFAIQDIILITLGMGAFIGFIVS